jgi:spermidine/putrescine transport system permease protein
MPDGAGVTRRVAGLPVEGTAVGIGAIESTAAKIRPWPTTMAVIAYGLPIAFILLPLVAFLTYSFFSVAAGQMHYNLTLLNYRRFFADQIFLPVFWQTCLLCLEVALLAVGFGYPVAYLLAGLRGRMKYALLMLLLVPLLMSYIIKIYAIRSILGGNGFLNRALLGLGLIDQPLTIFVYNLNAVLLTLTALLIPFAVLPIFLSLERRPRNLLEASADLGASDLQTFSRVVLPLSLPGTITAAIFVFVLAIGDFLTPQMVGGQSGFTFGRIIYSQFGTAFNWPFGSALSVILAAVVILAIIAGARLGRPRGQSR